MEEEVSKSQKKREAEALCKFGRELIDLPVSSLDQLPLSDILRRAIDEAKRIKSHGAIRRQTLLIGKLLRDSEHEEIVSALLSLQAEDKAQTAAFHAVEQWRTRLMDEGNTALTTFINQYQPDDVQALRQLIKKAIDEHKAQKSLGASKALFRLLRSYIL